MPGALSNWAGGSFLLQTCGSRPSFVPENFSEEQKELAKIAREFAMRETLAITDRIEAKETGLVVSLIKKAGGLGFLMAEIPEEFGGVNLGKVAAALIAENMAYQGSFSVAFMCHTGIGMLPLLYYGTDEQKTKYLPKLASGEMIGAYALTESEAGSDALAARARAVLSDDGRHYILNGEKIYCTNGGIADLITVFAKVDGDKFTAFLVEKGSPSLSVGKEEEKMGINGSSTTAIIMNDVAVPVENVLGEVGRGHKIAFNTLNIGRFKLGSACLGSSKRLIENIAPQANTRRQFGVPISSFELIRQKIARIVCRTYFLESMVYRYASDLDSLMSSQKLHDAIEELAVEAAIIKVYGSETLSFAADEAVQIFGGSGFIKGYLVERAYRDCRVNRIFEGTNEICRLIIPATLVKRAMAGKISLMERLGEVLDGLKKGFETADKKLVHASLIDQVESLKRAVVYLTGVAVQKCGEHLKEREALMDTIADTAIETYAFDSGVARAVMLSNMGDIERSARAAKICEVFLAERVPVIIAKARQMLINAAGGDEKEYAPYLKVLSRLAEPLASDTDKIYDSIAARVLEKEGYAF